MPGTTAKVSLSTTGMNNLKSNLKYEARETLNKASYSAFSTSDSRCAFHPSQIINVSTYESP